MNLYSCAAQLAAPAFRAPRGRRSVPRACFPNSCDIVAAMPSPVVVELGARNVSGVLRRGHFPNAGKYIGVDIHPGEGVDIVGDAHRLSEFIAAGFGRCAVLVLGVRASAVSVEGRARDQSRAEAGRRRVRVDASGLARARTAVGFLAVSGRWPVGSVFQAARIRADRSERRTAGENLFARRRCADASALSAQRESRRRRASRARSPTTIANACAGTSISAKRSRRTIPSRRRFPTSATRTSSIVGCIRPARCWAHSQRRIVPCLILFRIPITAR